MEINRKNREERMVMKRESVVLTIVAFLSLSITVILSNCGGGGGSTPVPPAYSTGDAVGTWSGFEVIVDNNFNLVDTYTSNATVLQNLTFTVNNKYGTTTGTIARSSPPAGAFGVDVTLPGNIAGEGAILISADKSFVGGGTCPNNVTAWSDCSWSAWTRQ
jgi:hypothetical protein